MKRLLLFVMIGCSSVPLGGRADAEAMQLWGGAAVQEWSRAAEATVLADMSQATPASALSPMKLKKGCWKVIPYEMVGGPAGKMVFAPPEANAPELTLPLNVKETAWYASVRGFVFSTSEVPTVARLRLEADPASVVRENRRSDHYGNSEEVFFKVAKLTAESRLCIGQQSTGMVCGCGVTHVKLIPLSPEEVARLEADRGDASHRTLWPRSTVFRPSSTQSADGRGRCSRRSRSSATPTSARCILHSPGADKVNYPSAVGHMKGTDAEEFPRVGDRHFVESIRELGRQEDQPDESADRRGARDRDEGSRGDSPGRLELSSSRTPTTGSRRSTAIIPSGVASTATARPWTA